MLPLVGLFVPAATAAAAAPSQAAGAASKTPQHLTDTGAQFWEWAVKEPIPTNPLTDLTGKYCNRGQDGETWFLGGVFTAPTNPNPPSQVTRTCTVSAGKKLVFPVLNDVEGNSTPGPTNTVSGWRKIAAANIATATAMAVTVDGRKLPASDLKYEESRVFRLKLGDNNIFGLTPQVVKSTVDAGYYVHLDQLPAGKHTIHIQGSATPGGSPFSVDVTYNLTISRP
jgi:hypothetical protein